MEMVKEVLSSLFAADSIWSIVFRGAIWFVIAIVIIMSVDNPNSESQIKNLKSNLGFLLMFIVLSSVLTMMLFGHVSA
jgi:hypothetical protein